MRPFLAALFALTFAIPSIARNIDSPPKGLTIVDWSQIRAEYDRHRHTAFSDGPGFKARTRELEWNTRFDGRGFEIRPDDATWSFGLELIGQSNARVTVNKNRVTYRWSPNLEEWFVNESQGMEHGFTLHKKSALIQLAIRGNLHAVGSGTAIRLLNNSGTPVLTYSGLRAWDATGRALPARVETSNGILSLSVDDREARYPITIDPLVQQAYLKPAAVGTTQAGDAFGLGSAISGDTLVVGAFMEDSASLGVNSIPNEDAADAGAAYVFVRSGGVWSQQAYLKPASVGLTQAGDAFGSSVSISGDTIVVGALSEDSSSLGVNSTPNEGSSFAGAAYIFVRSAGVWSQQAYLKPAAVGTTQASDAFGVVVSISGDTVVVGATGEDGSGLGSNSTPDEASASSGAAYVFVRNAGFLDPASLPETGQRWNLPSLRYLRRRCVRFR
jgi:hypothetical protein